jgi:hypothetical protein
MARPIAPAKGIAFAFPDVCQTPTPSGSTVPVPYPNVAQLQDADPVSDIDGKQLLVGGDPVLLEGATVDTSTGNEAGSSGGVITGETKGKCEITSGSGSVFYGPDRTGLVRFMDTTKQNKSDADGNADGMVLSAFPSVLVGD